MADEVVVRGVVRSISDLVYALVDRKREDAIRALETEVTGRLYRLLGGDIPHLIVNESIVLMQGVLCSIQKAERTASGGWLVVLDPVRPEHAGRQR